MQSSYFDPCEPAQEEKYRHNHDLINAHAKLSDNYPSMNHMEKFQHGDSDSDSESYTKGSEARKGSEASRGSEASISKASHSYTERNDKDKNDEKGDTVQSGVEKSENHNDEYKFWLFGLFLITIASLYFYWLSIECDVDYDEVSDHTVQYAIENLMGEHKT